MKIYTLYYKMNANKRKIKITISYNKKVAMRFHKTQYYKAMAEDIKILPKKDKEKNKVARKPTKVVDRIIAEYKTKDYTHVWKILHGIFKTRQRAVNGLAPSRKASQLMSVMTNIDFLITCYKNIRRKKGASTKGQDTPSSQLKNLQEDQRALLNDTRELPDRMSLRVFEAASLLLKQGKYPWGISRRVFIPKPGSKDVLRPITIPPFMDRVIQEGIRRILESIYEPHFEHQNRSFGFRPNKGVHDAIYGLTRVNNGGMYTAIEGDIKAAYDKVNRKKLMEILREEINDHSFLNLIESRLEYTFYDTNTNLYVKDKDGLPQGGIDSPYLWNIYMLKFDKFVRSHLDYYCTRLNAKMKVDFMAKTKRLYEKSNLKKLQEINHRMKRHKNTEHTKEYNKVRGDRRQLVQKLRILNKLKTGTLDDRTWKTFTKYAPALKSELSLQTSESVKILRYEIIKQIRLNALKRNKTRTLKPKRYILRYYYTRYADDWIIIGNFNKGSALRIKEQLAKYLSDNLHATLSSEKTLITDMRKEPAHFLGFELYVRNTYKISNTLRKQPDGSSAIIKGRKNNTRIVARPDIQRMLNRAYMKRFCDKDGRPTHIPWLSTLDTFAIIERYNACIRGVANFYAEWVTYPSTLYRWLYILRYSCLKTIAQKYNTTISGVFARFGTKTNDQDTITYKVTLSFPTKGEMTKTWKLVTSKEAIQAALSLDRRKNIEDIFETIESGNYIDKIEYVTGDGRSPRVMDVDFLEKINWVTRRSTVSLGLPCTICGEVDNVEMHHIKHVRKTSYSKINENEPWRKLMALRNRKQIPVCLLCHRTLIHTGSYTGPRLTNLAPVKKYISSDHMLYDTRQVNIENFVKPGKFYGPKTLEEKGWRPSSIFKEDDLQILD